MGSYAAWQCQTAQARALSLPRQPRPFSVTGAAAAAASSQKFRLGRIHADTLRREPWRHRPRIVRVRAAQTDEEFELERLMTRPRLVYGLDVHRRLHAMAARNPGYLFQWRAFCERNGLDWKAVVSDEDEALLAGGRVTLQQNGRRLLYLSKRAGASFMLQVLTRHPA